MSGYLGLDTSNYPTSAAYWAQGADKPVQAKQLLQQLKAENGQQLSLHLKRQISAVLWVLRVRTLQKVRQI